MATAGIFAAGAEITSWQTEDFMHTCMHRKLPSATRANNNSPFLQEYDRPGRIQYIPIFLSCSISKSMAKRMNIDPINRRIRVSVARTNNGSISVILL
jgi:hypothetical protein